MKAMHDVMVDLETLGKRPGCAVVAIGACFFGPGGLGLRFYATARLHDQTLLGRIEPETVGFWLDQDDPARRELRRADAMEQASMLAAFRTWYSENNGRRIWAHGLNFDLPVLEAAMRLHGVEPPWDHRVGRDTRTVLDLAEMTMPSHPEGSTKHNALSDAVLQAQAMVAAHRKLALPGWVASSAPAFRETSVTDLTMVDGV